MKYIIRMLIFALMLAILPLSFVSLSGCDDCECTDSSSDANRNLNGYDLNAASEYYNQAVVNFRFTQTTTDHVPSGGDCNCPLDDVVTTLTIKNNTDQTISFDYEINFQLNFASWNYANSATIAPNGTLEVGQVTTNPASITHGQFMIASGLIDYD